MKIRVLLPTLALVLFLAACSRPAPAPDTSAADEAAIRSAIDTLLVSWNAGDTAALTPLFGDDIRWYRPEGTVTGRDAVLAAMAEVDHVTMQQTATVDEVAVYQDHAHALGTWTMTPTVAAPAGTPTNNGKWLIVWKRAADGTWKEWRWIHNQSPPAGS